MNNIFENAKFGDKFCTKDGRMAIYVKTNNRHHFLLVEEYMTALHYAEDGTANYINRGLDIISQWQDSINEEELEKIAAEWVADNCKVYVIKEDVMELTDFDSARSTYKAGYRKALEKQ